jgi:RNA polymerase sigma factor for flagellar operon FliA
MTAIALPVVEPPNAPPQPTPSRQDLWRRYHTPRCRGRAEIENELVKEYLPLVRQIVGRLAMTLPSHVDFDDLHSAGLVGLLQALRNYDPGCGTSFETYARTRIRGAVLDELRRMDWAPRSVHEKSRRVQQVMCDLGQELGSIPNEGQMAKALGLSLNDYEKLLDEIRPTTFICLDTANLMESGDTNSLYDVVADQTQDDPTARASSNELADLVGQFIRKLPPNQQRVLALYYFEDLHLREIATVFGVTESRICQIHSQAILAIKGLVAKYENSALCAA